MEATAGAAGADPIGLAAGASAGFAASVIGGAMRRAEARGI